MQDMPVLASRLLIITRDKINMNFNSASVNNCYIIDKKIFENTFFIFMNAKAVYSASIFHLAFFKGDINSLTDIQLKNYEMLSIDLYRMNSPYLYIPFETNFHENILYQSYYESDHFPLSLWLEEKRLIPFNILIQIIEDTLNGLNALENAGHSHLFLTPEEILIPLQWKEDTNVKLCNIGINSIVNSLLSENEIINYRNFYSKSNNISFETNLVKNLSDDIYAFGKILIKISSLCNFNNVSDKNIITKNINMLIDNPESFKTIDDVTALFELFFIGNNKPKNVFDKNFNSTYTDQASFDIPEYNNWKEEAVLEPIILPEVDKKESIIQKNNIGSKIHFRLLHTLPSIISFFSRRRKRKDTSKHISDLNNEFYLPQTVNKTDTVDEIVNNSEESKILSFQDRSLTNNRKTAQILIEIENHYRKLANENKPIESTISNINNSIASENQEKNVTFPDYDKNISNIEIISTDSTLQKTLTIFKNYLQNREYYKNYEIITKFNNKEHDLPDKYFTKELENILDNKLKQLDDHYTKTDSTDILIKLAKIDSIMPKKSKEINNELIKSLNTASDPNSIDLENKTERTLKNISLFKKIVLYLKSKLYGLLNK